MKLRIEYGTSLAVLGDYDLFVHQGQVSVQGASFGTVDGLFTLKQGARVSTPSVGSIPLLKASSTEGAVIELRDVPPVYQQEQSLRRFSPLFDYLNASSFGDGASFTLVRSSGGLYSQLHNAPLTLIVTD